MEIQLMLCLFLTVFKDRKKSVKKLLMERTVAASLGTSPKNSWEEAIANPGKEINATLSLAEKKRGVMLFLIYPFVLLLIKSILQPRF